MKKLVKRSTSYGTATIIINSFLTFSWWLVFNPGFFAPDSLGILNMVSSDAITSEYTQVWGLAVDVLTLSGTHPAIATLIFSQLLSISFSVIALTLFKEKTARYSSLAIILTPTFGAMAITLWHDIPSTSGLFLATAGILRFRNSPRKSQILIICGFFFAAFRYNGLLTVSIAGLIYAAHTKQKKLATFVTLSTLVMGLGFYALDVNNSKVVNAYSDGSVNWMRYDISCYASKKTVNSEKFFMQNFDDKYSDQFWQSKSACTWFNDSDAWSKRNSFNNDKMREVWANLFISDPKFIFETHLRRNSYLIPFPIYGLPNPPFLHTKIDENIHAISFTSPTVSENARAYPRAWNFFNNIFAWGGFWLGVIFAFAWVRKAASMFTVFGIGVIISLGLFITAVIPDGRYVLFILLLGQLILAANSKLIVNQIQMQRWRFFR
jgi:hypothetical protein